MEQATNTSTNTYPRNKYSDITKKEFKDHLLVGKKKSRFELVYFILNTLYHISNPGYWYCYCQSPGKGKCQMCMIPKIFVNFTQDIENNIFDYEFLFFYYTKLSKELLKLIPHGKMDFVECFLNEYVFGGRDYSTATSWSVPFSESIRYNKEIQIERLKREKLPLPPDYREPVIDLTCTELSG